MNDDRSEASDINVTEQIFNLQFQFVQAQTEIINLKTQLIYLQTQIVSMQSIITDQQAKEQFRQADEEQALAILEEMEPRLDIEKMRVRDEALIKKLSKASERWSLRSRNEDLDAETNREPAQSGLVKLPAWAVEDERQANISQKHKSFSAFFEGTASAISSNSNSNNQAQIAVPGKK